ncbi:hypothetical protein O181_065938 [Austropuccinia psidii MF-1]|uniref:Zona occludens toxin N-terminal domain-containing protein n=1 Tax=Austropuccinia psidii MF-1 TaxID=1389203 RepID=A0A9Q3I338_9BASI|nr:hypothetical protein [Austropuccinia psidii MF-1]
MNLNPDPEMILLHPLNYHKNSNLDSEKFLPSFSDFNEDEFKNVPIITGDAATLSNHQFPQRTILGTVISQHARDFPKNLQIPKLYINTNTPFSAIICGVQGSGKSHSASVLLEGCLINDKRIGNLPKPLIGLCLHYDPGQANLPCEAAYLAIKTNNPQITNPSPPKVPVTVLVSPHYIGKMKSVYSKINQVKILPFYISQSSLNASRILSLMGFTEGLVMPLYLQRAMTILRQMGGDKFNYQAFKTKMNEEDLNPAQRSGFLMRTEMLESYLTNKDHPDMTSYFQPGRLLIIDLRDPFINSSLVSVLFDIVLGLFIESKMGTGKVLLLDEAHKYLNTSTGSAQLTHSITSLIRQQRHFGIRTLISTQEPTIIPSTMLDIASFILIHRFSSPSWAKHLNNHICCEYDDTKNDFDWFNIASRARLGEAILVAPTGLGLAKKNNQSTLMPLSTGFLLIQTRKRLTFDGGASILAHKV